MKTNEELVTALGQAAEAEIHQLVRALMYTSDAPLKTLEQQVLQVVFSLGRRWLERLLAWRTSNHAAAARRQGACGHQQRLVGWRAKTLLTLLGQVEWGRPYYQCQEAAAAQAGAEPAASVTADCPARRRTSGRTGDAAAETGTLVVCE